MLAGTEDYFEALARSRYLVSNDDMSAIYLKRDSQVYVQTWHGTPLKKIGFDISQPQFISGSAYFDQLAQDIAKWDLLLSPNPFSTAVMRRAFRFDGEICESGYPRNDVLHAPDADEIAAQVLRRIGVPPGKRVVLYAPTWRDNQYYASGRYRFDFRLDLERAWRALGDDYVFLIRGHHHMADDVPAGTRPGFAINVTAYPDISELFLISNVLVTDYSSAMCDFAATGRPIVLFTYDLEQYRDDLRGFYLDLAAEAPGPLLATTDEVAAAIRDLDGVAENIGRPTTRSRPNSARSTTARRAPARSTASSGSIPTGTAASVVTVQPALTLNCIADPNVLSPVAYQIEPGEQISCTVTLSGAASAATTVTLASNVTSSPGVTVPASVVIAAGATSATFTATGI